ncbi:maker235 [Drosophila busckii]|uniref:Maker235 n=1 Tax=Drosophila busckii TaxID=30019 RepID=A0A0M4EP44_DROBS|nr:maker235 [Drosophila busckii]
MPMRQQQNVQCHHHQQQQRQVLSGQVNATLSIRQLC